MQDLTLSLIQTTQSWEDKDTNLGHFERLLEQCPSAGNLIVLPEMFNTGFTMNVETCSETMDGTSVKWMHAMAKKYDTAIAASLIISDAGQYFNRFLLVHPSGEIKYYDKRHLFTMAGEHEVFTQGNEIVIWDLDTWKICPQVCYDLRFPVWSRNTTGFDLLLYTANWPKKRINHWVQLLKARAIENQCYVAGINRIGLDGNDIQYNGNSLVANFDGDLVSFNQDEEVILTTTLSRSELDQRRQLFPVLNDRDSFRIV
ncbi:MAG: amidohydrolase [Bacteroidia bacterium]|nr:amidohydrolase [Bacteroidia bacterium]